MGWSLRQLFTRRRRLNLALQGGGAHGAFTWGVLDRLLEDDDFSFSWVSGTSAGAVNAVALVSGLANGGRDGARQVLRKVWEGVETAGVPDFFSFLPGLSGRRALAEMTPLLSPYTFNPMRINPLQELLCREIDMEAVRKFDEMGVLIAATEVVTGRARLFTRSELSVEAVLASACLPTLHHAVEIDGVAYWDGGYSANPDVLSLVQRSTVEDTLIVQLNPTRIDAVPRTASEILAHVNDLTFNQPLLRDISVIVQAKDAGGGAFASARSGFAKLRRHRFHLISAGRHTIGLDGSSKVNPERRLVRYLFEAGRADAETWLVESGRLVGRNDSVDLRRAFLLDTEGQDDDAGEIPRRKAQTP